MAICWTRVDDRLIHGQVIVAWRHYLGYQAIILVDDEVAGDPFLREVLALALPGDLTIEIYAAAEAIAALSQPPGPKTMLLFKAPQAALALVEGGLPLARLNVGNLAAKPGSVRVQRSISVTAADAAALDALSARGVDVFLQPTPDDPALGWPQVRKRVRF